MGNMSHCRFHNTSYDLQECIDILDGEFGAGLFSLSDSERVKSEEIRHQCETFIRLYDEDEERNETATNQDKIDRAMNLINNGNEDEGRELIENLENLNEDDQAYLNDQLGE